MTVIMLPDSESKKQGEISPIKMQIFTLLDGSTFADNSVLCKMHSKSDEKVIAVIN